MKNIRPGRAAFGLLAVFVVLSTFFFVGRRLGEARVSPDEVVGPTGSQACRVEAECKPAQEPTPTPAAATGQPTLAFPTALKLPPRGMVIEVPVEVELAHSQGGD